MELIIQFFTYLSYLGNPENKPDASFFQNYLADNCIVKSNNEILSQGIEEFLDYIEMMQQKYLTVSYSDFLEPPIICGDKAVLHFHVDCLMKTGVRRNLDAMAIVTIEKGRISIWEEVFTDIQG
ncbi:MAG TPA: nuclear transport factor 2 family protein [Chlamydiales bacterium]|nr:nuclear transport factor 2 family protein [Chlamydiales bacterium]